MLRTLWKDEGGAVVSAELAIIATLLTIGLVTGLNEVRDSFIRELEDVSNAVGAVDQTFRFHAVETASGVTPIPAETAGTLFTDNQDRGDLMEQTDQTDLVGDPPVPE